MDNLNSLAWPPPKRSASGFSLIELIVVITLLGIGLVAVSGMFVSGVISDTKAERIARATNAAQRELERLRSAGFSGCIVHTDVFPTTSYTIVEQYSDLTGRVRFPVSGLPSGTGTVQIGYYTSAIGTWPNLKQIAVTVSWSGARRTQGSVRMVTLIGNRPQ
jgi:prepilin-type N-terminal cleavage/methylation domain-containing protein